MQTITTIGLDNAKSVFQVHGVDGNGQVVIRRQPFRWMRSSVAGQMREIYLPRQCLPGWYVRGSLRIKLVPWRQF